MGILEGGVTFKIKHIYRSNEELLIHGSKLALWKTRDRVIINNNERKDNFPNQEENKDIQVNLE